MNPRLLFSGLLGGLVGALCCVVAFGQTPKEDFSSDELLEIAAAEIRRFDSDQLEALIEYLATCGIPMDTRERDFACERAKARLEVKTLTASAVRRIVIATALTEHLVKLSWDRSSGQERARLADDIKRKVDIQGRFSRAASQRYTELMRTPKGP